MILHLSAYNWVSVGATSKHIVMKLSIGTDRHVQTVDPDQTPQNAASDQGLHVCNLERCSAVVKHRTRDREVRVRSPLTSIAVSLSKRVYPHC